MIIAIPVNENKAEPSVCVSFGRAPWFYFRNTETATSQVLANPAAIAEGGAGVKAAQFVIDHHADALITVRGGENAAEVLLAAEVQIYKAQGGGALENLAALAEGKLERLQSFHAGFHNKQ
ncbi:MAG: dinitrogenase iron-molybdenum cofactor biosynthesis protein [Clostridiales bacterium]|nr:dinitrogenase iron-molybdenum cofactor biosynthesis protein [Clostridiales bacterium]